MMCVAGNRPWTATIKQALFPVIIIVRLNTAGHGYTKRKFDRKLSIVRPLIRALGFVAAVYPSENA